MNKNGRGFIYLLGIVFFYFTDVFWEFLIVPESIIGGGHFKRLVLTGLVAVFLSFVLKTTSERALAASEERYRYLFEASRDIIFTLSTHGKLVAINQAFEKITGFSRKRWLGKQALFLVHPDQRDELRQNLIPLLQAQRETSVSAELQVTTLDKQRLICEVIFTLRRVSDKTRQIYGIARNITERKQAEQELAAQKEWLTVTLRSIGDGVIATDILGRIVLMNPVAERLTGWSTSEATGRLLPQVFLLAQDYSGEPCLNPVQTILNHGQSVALTKNIVLVARNQLNRYYISNIGSPIRDSWGVIIGAVLVFRDISQQRKCEEEMLKNQKLESIGILAGGIAHDFNNILAGILANTQLTQLLLANGKTVEKYLTGIEDGVTRAAALTRQLLTFSKGGAPIKKIASLGELLRTTVDFSLRGSNSKYELTTGEPLWPVEIDSDQINQVINNLIINADQAMPDGGIIRVSAENIHWVREDDPPYRKGEFIKITICDQGIGIPEENLPYIFDPYFTTKPNGSGLGLATSYSIIKKHDGYINVQSRIGQGSAFTIYLPATVDTSCGAPIQKTPPIQKGHGKILLMDDDEMLRGVAGEMLSLLGYEVEYAKEGREAIDLYEKSIHAFRPYDAVIMDLTVPGGLGGKTTIDKLLKLNPAIKVIVSSGYPDNPLLADYQKFGFSGVMVKPYKMEELSQILHRVLSENQVLQAN